MIRQKALVTAGNTETELQHVILFWFRLGKGDVSVGTEPAMHESSVGQPAQGCAPRVRSIFDFQKVERPPSLSNLDMDVALFQKNIQALCKPLSCWPAGHLELPEMQCWLTPSKHQAADVAGCLSLEWAPGAAGAL